VRHVGRQQFTRYIWVSADHISKDKNKLDAVNMQQLFQINVMAPVTDK